MLQVVLRPTDTAQASAAEALSLVASHAGRVINQSGRNLLIELDAAHLDALRESLTGWIVSPQGAPIPVPDTRIRIRSDK